MLKIYKLRADHVIDFAAEELKKYLRMMMPDCGDIPIFYAPEATDGFRLGLLEDFSLPCEAEDVVLDDIIHVDTDEQGGILAGSNPRSVLFSVYRMLRENGCRWLYPGVDGDYVPMQDIVPVKYHKLADHRFRGHCNEGAESQTCMLETIDFFAKQELNVYMIEFNVPFFYYDYYYSHFLNEGNRPPEPVTPAQVIQWKRQCEVEIAKRGLMFHDMGHGWTADPMGMSADNRNLWRNGTLKVPEDIVQYLALRDGKRTLNNSDPLWTNLCYSNPVVRTRIAQAVADYIQGHSNVDYLHVWLSDGARCHCECEECQKATPSDYYIMMMNELDEILQARNLNTRIVFIAYLDTLFAPERETIKNPRRFSLLYAPILRSYTESIDENTPTLPADPYIRNAWETPVSAAANLAHLRKWQEGWKGPCFEYEYHFWRHQYLDPGGMYIARRVYEDIMGLKHMKLTGIVEDGSQRSFFPNGFAMYIYAEALMNRDCDFETVKEDYFSHIYGEKWKTVVSMLQSITDAFDFGFMQGEKTIDRKVSQCYDPARAEKIAAVRDVAAEMRRFVEQNYRQPIRVQTVSIRMLKVYADYAEGLANIMVEKALGHNFKAIEMSKEFFHEIGKYEIEWERYYDHTLACRSIERLLRMPKKPVLE